jgi:hypothetical protein
MRFLAEDMADGGGVGAQIGNRLPTVDDDN